MADNVKKDIQLDDLLSILSSCRGYWAYAHERHRQNYAFAHGKQWDDQVAASRTSAHRECQVYNIVPGFVRPLVNTTKQAPPGIMVYPVSQDATKDDADILAGVIRHVEYRSNAARAYTLALELTAEASIGAWRVVPRTVLRKRTHIKDNQVPAFDAMGNPTLRNVPLKEVIVEEDIEIAIEQIDDPTNLLIDPTSTMAGFSDAKFYIYTYPMGKQDYLDAGYGDDSELNDKIMPTDTIDIHEYWYINDEGYIEICIFTDTKVISHEATQLMVLPFVCITGRKIINGEGFYFECIVDDIKAPQKEINWAKSETITTVSQAPKSTWIADEGAIVDPEAWANSSTDPDLVLYKKEGKSVTQIPAPGAPTGYMEVTNANIEVARLITGIYPDPTTQQRLSNASGKAIKYQTAQSQINTYHYIDALNYGVKSTGEIVMDMISVYYNTDDIRISLGVDQSYNRVSIGPTQVPNVKNIDLSYSQYGISVSTGPGYATQKEAYFETLKDFASQNKDLAPVILEAIMRNAPIPNAEMYADRAVMLLPQQVQQMIAVQHSDDPKAVIMQQQLQLNQAQQKMQAMQQHLEQLASDLEQEKSSNAVKIADMQNKREIAHDDNLTRMAMQQAELQSKEDLADKSHVGKIDLANVKSMNAVSEHAEKIR